MPLSNGSPIGDSDQNYQNIPFKRRKTSSVSPNNITTMKEEDSENSLQNSDSLDSDMILNDDYQPSKSNFGMLGNNGLSKASSTIGGKPGPVKKMVIKNFRGLKILLLNLQCNTMSYKII